jgi:hypothetical protein
MDHKTGIKEADLADVDLASLNRRRMEAVEKQTRAADRVRTGKAGHFLSFWLGGGAAAVIALWLAQRLPEHSQIGMFVLSAFIILAIGMWIAAFFPALTMRRLQDEATAANRHVMDLDLKIAFGHQVREEAKRVKVQWYAEALVAKEAAPKKPGG